MSSHNLEIWVDADAIPKRARELLIRAIKRLEIPTTFVADRPLRLPSSYLIQSIQVKCGIDEADDAIVKSVKAGDLVITGDLPLAKRVIEVEATAMNPRGETYTLENIQERVAMRNLRQELRDAGIMSGGPSAYGDGHAHSFAGALDRWLTKRLK